MDDSGDDEPDRDGGGGRRVDVEDHVDALLFGGTSVGVTVPGLSSLSLAAGSAADRDLLHAHEMAHRLLLDDTAWGAALHLLHAGGECARAEYVDYLAATMRTHEGWATFASLQITEHIHPDVRAFIARRPAYVAYLATFETLLIGVGGASRRYHAAWAVARACSRSGVLRTLFAGDGSALPLSAVPRVDRPDTRLALLRDLLPARAGVYAVEADAAFAEREGRQPGRGLETDASDQSWLAWADSFEQAVCSLLVPTGAHIPGADDYLTDAVAVQQRLPLGHPGRDLRVGSADEETSDAAWLHENLMATRWPLVQGLRQGKFGHLGAAIDPTELVDLIAATAAVSGTPELTLHLRPTRRLLAGWDWDVRSVERIKADGKELQVCARVLLNDADTGVAEVLHVGLDDLVGLLRVWARRGPVTAVVTTSAFLLPLATRWLEALAMVADVVVLMDVSVQNLLAGDAPFLPAGQTLRLRRVSLTNNGLDVLQWTIRGQGFVGLMIADGTSVDLVREQLQAVRPTATGMAADWERWDGSAQRALRSLLTTESFFDLRGAVGEVNEP